ncbi:hypothetical protein MTR_6g049480 [Medicago truncatula]|uniref:Uncharacterized protein n=1 Tax=Medicago truncatula TaxID=3880 RepID=A0A072UA48_MEDTR|nr:hypothetical protein MTR_6g049480 [Medicago truncatula]
MTELGYFKNNEIGTGQGRNERLMEKVRSMVKAKESGYEEFWRTYPTIPRQEEVYSLMFIVDMGEKRESIKVNDEKIKETKRTLIRKAIVTYCIPSKDEYL